MTESRDGTTGNSNTTKNRRVPTPGTLRYRLLLMRRFISL